MNLLTDLLKESSVTNVKRIVSRVEENPGLIKQLVDITLKNNAASLKASWALTHCHDKMPRLLQPYIEELIKAAPGFSHTGTRRSVLRILAAVDIPEDYQVFMFDHCLQWVISRKEPVAVKVHAIEILTNIALLEPDLKNEVIPVILDVMPHGTAALKARGKSALKKLGAEDL